MRMESHLIWNRKPAENMHDYAMLLCIFKAILRGWSLNCYSHVQNLRTMSHGWLIHSIPRPKNEMDPNRFRYLSLFQYQLCTRYSTTPHVLCASVFSPFAPGIFQTYKSVNSPWAVFNKLKPTKITPAYPEISRNKEYANPHVSKNMQKHVSDNASPKPRTELWKSPSTQHHASATNLLATPQSHARNHPKIPCISYHTLAQHSTGASSFLIMTKAEFWAQLPWGGNGY